MNKITRIEVIDENGRSYVNWEDDNDVSWQFQDDGRTLKVFVNKVKSKSPVEECYKDWWGVYPGTEIWTNFDETRWVGFKAGYNAAYEEKVSEEPEVREWDVVRESMNWCKEHPDKDPLDWLKPQTPDQVADGLKEAFREAVKQGVVSSTKSPTLYDVIADWWDDTFTKKETSLQDLVDRIEEWLPTEHETNSYKWNECIRMIRENLR